MPLAIDAPQKLGRLTTVLIYQQDYDSDGWGWWCPKCSRPELLIGQDGFVSSAKARRSAHLHEERRGHQ